MSDFHFNYVIGDSAIKALERQLETSPVSFQDCAHPVYWVKDAPYAHWKCLFCGATTNIFKDGHPDWCRTHPHSVRLANSEKTTESHP